MHLFGCITFCRCIGVETYEFVCMEQWVVTRHHQILQCPKLGLLKCKFSATHVLNMTLWGK